MLTRLAFKLILSWAIALLFAPALGAGTGGVGSIHDLDRDASERRLVFHEGPQLVERPRLKPVVVKHPVADALKVFNANSLPFGFGFVNDTAADGVVDLPLDFSPD